MINSFLTKIGKGKRLVKIALIVVLIVVGYWAFYSNRPETPITPNLTSPVDANDQLSIKKDEIGPSNDPKEQTQGSFLLIKEWGVKIGMQEAEKVTYDIEDYPYAVYGQEVSVLSLRVKPEYLEDKSCNIIADWTKYQRQDDRLKEIAVKIGDSYYVSGSSPYNCQNATDNKLYEKVLADFTNIQAL